MGVVVTLGNIKLEFKARSNRKGIVEWNQGDEVRAGTCSIWQAARRLGWCSTAKVVRPLPRFLRMWERCDVPVYSEV